MKIHQPDAYHTASEMEIIAEHLPIRGARLLELGCGDAWMTRQIAESLRPGEIIATEVDQVQHQKNLQKRDLPGVRFLYAGAEDIPLEDASVDLVLMLKSLHHVPLDSLDLALSEITRVLKPGGIAYISEPVYQGAFNDIMKLFHDEQKVRQAAFDAVCRAVEEGRLELVRQIFFHAPGHFQDFAEFEQRMLQVTHTQHQIDASLHARIKQTFEQHMTDKGADFLKPMRIDLLRKPDH